MSSSRPSRFKCSAVISDVDGTLVTNEKISDRAYESRRGEAASKRNPFSIVSSRPPRGLRMLFAPLGITMPVAGFNGGMLVTAESRGLSQSISCRLGSLDRAVDVLDARRVAGVDF